MSNSPARHDETTGPENPRGPEGPDAPSAPGGPQRTDAPSEDPQVLPSSPPDGPQTIPAPEPEPAPSPGPDGRIHAGSQAEQANEELQEENAGTALDQPSDGSGGE
jgi:hypothetical protein